MISFCCPGCRATFKLPDELAGKTARCSKCDQRFTVPATAEPAAETGQMAAAATATSPAKKVALKPVQEVLAAQTMRAGVAPSAKPFDDVEVVNVVVDKVEVVEAESSLQDPPRRSIVRDDDDDMPRRRRRRSSSGSSTGIIIGSIVGGLVFLAVVVVVIVLLVNRTSRMNQAPLAVLNDPPPLPPPQNNAGMVAGQQNPAPAANNPAAILDRQDQLTRNDPFDREQVGCRAKRYTVQLEANKTYVIDMIAANQLQLDPFLRLELNGVTVAADDDGGDNLNARIVFHTQQAGQYVIVATTFEERQTGSFRLLVRAQ
jgi:hypothetical protein